ncbi:hypothetical protein [Streptomyces fagopyri]
MTHSARIAGIGHLGKPLKQVGDFPGRYLGMLTELAKGRQDRR